MTRTTRRHAPGGIFRASRPDDRERQYEPPDWIQWDDETYRGDAYATYGWGCDVAELEIDRDTCEVRPRAAHRGAGVRQGRFIPRSRSGQIEGRHRAGTRLCAAGARRDAERRDGQRPAHQLHDPHDARHAARSTSCMLENPYPGGPFGAKGLGELPMDGPAPAVVNAIRQLGLDVREIPPLPRAGHEAACASR